MRNYYAALELSRNATVQNIFERLQQLNYQEPAMAEKAEAILLVETRKVTYDQVHLQYEAIGLAYQAFKSEISDTNDWEKRLVEFVSPHI